MSAKDYSSDEFYCCEWINSGLHFQPTRLGFCCNSSQSIGDHPQISEQYSGEYLNKNILNKIKKIKENFKKGKIFKGCKQCSLLKKQKWDGLDEQYFDHFVFTNTHKCNSKCIYCFTNDLSEEVLNLTYNVYPVIKQMRDEGLMKFLPTSTAVFSGGEPTISNDFEQLLNFFLDNDCPNLKVHSSGILFSKSVVRGLEKGDVEIIISTDAGKKETFYKIKRVDAFNKVMANIKKYVEKAKNPEQVKIKFIIIPGINDSIKEIDLWFNNILNCGIKSIACDIEQHWFYNHIEDKNKKMFALLDYFKCKAEEYNLMFEYYAPAKKLYDNI